ncbi:MAG: hypothetical protein U9R19_12855 [Bacteroidota bacterium]|nr:hypothetical protein [Bacteroidota bacterium]
MMKAKPDQNLITKLKSGNQVKLLSALDRLRKIGNAAYLPVVIEALRNSIGKDKENHDAITNFIFDLKDQQSVIPLVDAIESEKNKAILPVLVSACWQNGLDYSEFAHVFINVFVKADFVVSIEAFSVIENMIFNIDNAKKKKMGREIKNVLPEMEEVKKKLASELVNLLS